MKFSIIFRLVVLFVFSLTSSTLISQKSEADYCDLINEKLKGVREVTVYAGRVDIVT